MLRVLVSLFFLLMPTANASSQQSAEIEVLHWWISSGEGKAIKTIKKAYEARGGVWVDRPQNSYDDLRKVAMEQILAGDPPGAMQWLAGPDLQTMLDLDLVEKTEKIARKYGWHGKMYPFVPSLAGKDGAFIAVPVSIHGESWAWYSSTIYKKLGLEYPQSWEEFLKQAPVIQKAGYVPLAASGQAWQLRILFSSVLLGVGGADAYNSLFINKDVKSLENPKVRAAFDVFRRLHKFVDEAHLDRGWDKATAMVMENKAAVQIMGDWAKGEFAAAGAKPGVDYECNFAPGTDKNYIALVDFFLLGRVEDENTSKAQVKFAQTVVSPEVQIAFAQAKGSIPVLENLPTAANELDQCANKAIKHIGKKGVFLPSINVIDDGEYVNNASNTLRSIWLNTDQSLEDAIAEYETFLKSAAK